MIIILEGFILNISVKHSMQVLRHAAGKIIDTYHLVFFNKVIMLYLGFLEILTIISITKGATDFLTLTFILNAPVGWIYVFFLWGGMEQCNKIRLSFCLNYATWESLYLFVLCCYCILIITAHIAGLCYLLEIHIHIYISTVSEKNLYCLLKLN